MEQTTISSYQIICFTEAIHVTGTVSDLSTCEPNFTLVPTNFEINSMIFHNLKGTFGYFVEITMLTNFILYAVFFYFLH